MFLVPTSAIGITGARGNDAANRAIPVLPGSRNGFSVLFDLVPSGKIPSAEVLNWRREHQLLRQARRHHLPLDGFQFGQ